jgi:hypothetical protein
VSTFTLLGTEELLVVPTIGNTGLPSPYNVVVTTGQIAALGTSTGSKLASVTIAPNNQDVIFTYQNSTTFTQTGLVTSISLAVAALATAAAASGKPSTAGTIWNSGNLLEVSDGNP